MAFVLDASVALGWFVRSQANAYTNRIRLLAQELHLPLASNDARLRRAMQKAGIKLA